MKQPDVVVREVGLRDGLQNVAAFFPTHAKQQWLCAEAAAGMPEIEVCSFVPPHVVAQFTDHADTVATALAIPGLSVAALVPNAKGAQRGFGLGVHKLNFVLSASETHNRANVKCSTDESLERFSAVMAERQAQPTFAHTKVSGCISTAMGCTFEGAVDPRRVLELVEQYLRRGADEIVIADTVGYTNPAAVKSLFRDVRALTPANIPVVAHFHDTRGLGLANVVAALDVGIVAFDASLAGLGGCPFAPEATGNVVMEDLVFMLEAMGLHTGVDVEALIAIRPLLREYLPDEPLHGLIARAGLPKNFHGGAAQSAANEPTAARRTQDA